MSAKTISHETDPEELAEYILEQHKRSLEATKQRRLQAEVNWQAYLGRQDTAVQGGEVKNVWSDMIYPYRVENIVRGQIDTQVGRMVKDMPNATTKPVTPDAAARGAAELVADYVDYLSFEWDVNALFADACLWGWVSGDAGLKVVFDVAENGIAVTPMQIWEYIVDETVRDVQKGRFCAFLSHRDKWDAAQLAVQMGAAEDEVDPEDLEEVEYKPNIMAEGRKAVQLREHWEKPNARCPEGLFALIVGQKVVVARPYPYMLPSRRDPGRMVAYLPLVTWSPGSTEDGPHGSTPLDDAVEQQRSHNETLSHIDHLTKLSAAIRGFGREDVLNQIRDGKSQWVPVSSREHVPVFMEPPRVSPALWAKRDEGPGKIAQTLGINDQIAGGRGWMSGQSARAVGFINEVDSWKLSRSMRRFWALIEGMWELTLMESITFISEEQQLAWPGADEFKVLALNTSQMHGVVVRIEPESGMEKMTASKQQAAKEEVLEGLADPAESADRIQSGFRETALDATNRKLALLDLTEVLGGGEPSLDADPQVAVKVLQEAWGMMIETRPQEAELCRQLAALYAQMLQQQAPPQEEPGDEMPTEGGEM